VPIFQINPLSYALADRCRDSALLCEVTILTPFTNKPELAHKVMDLPEIQKNFNDVPVVGFYPRAIFL